MKKFAVAFFLTILTCLLVLQQAAAAQDVPDFTTQVVQLGDTWTALAIQGDTTIAELLRANHAINRQREPTAGTIITLPGNEQISGQLQRPFTSGLLGLAAGSGCSPWAIALENRRANPYRPGLLAPLLVRGGDQPPRDLPPGFSELSIDHIPAQPGQAIALSGSLASAGRVSITLNDQTWPAIQNNATLIALGATGAFFPPGQPTLRIQVSDQPLWEQRLLFEPGKWTLEQVEFSATAVFDQDQLRLEREQLQTIWDQVTSRVFWNGPFQLPLKEYVEISSLYGARRSVNGGPYDTYHEGTDFSAYRGTPVYASAAGRVVLAEQLAVRGNAVILDHGLGLHSGYYHLSAIRVQPGKEVHAGDLLGEVGTTGRSTGNHLHWDLLVGRTWVDPLAWLDSNLAAWLLAEWPVAVHSPHRQEPVTEDDLSIKPQ